MGKRIGSLTVFALFMGCFFGAVLSLGGMELSPYPMGDSDVPTESLDISTVMSASSVEQNRPTVILDAGHGGEDGGAVSQSGAAEKSLNLSIALTLGDMLRACGVDVIYTRTDDNGLYDGAVPGHRKMTDLKNRLAVREAHPDAVFLSIHMNTFSDPRYDGMQVFYSVNDPTSALLAEHLRGTNKMYLQPDNQRACKAANSSIYLLDRARGTSVLAECGFLSNPEEAARLMTAEYREQIAAVLCIGILNYIKESS
jgi:N-acetylmuramoyl-L-alanine amidase